MIVERQGLLGGNMTTGLPLLGFLEAQKRQVTKGIAQELVDRLIELGGSFGHRECPLHNSTTVIDPNLMRIVIFEKIKQYNLKPILHCEIIYTILENIVL